MGRRKWRLRWIERRREREARRRRKIKERERKFRQMNITRMSTPRFLWSWLTSAAAIRSLHPLHAKRGRFNANTHSDPLNKKIQALPDNKKIIRDTESYCKNLS